MDPVAWCGLKLLFYAVIDSLPESVAVGSSLVSVAVGSSVLSASMYWCPYGCGWVNFLQL